MIDTPLRSVTHRNGGRVHFGSVSHVRLRSPQKKHTIQPSSAHHVQVSAWEGDVLGVRPVLAQDAENGAFGAVVPRAIAAILAHPADRARYII